jgi:hypothetical protein
MTGDLAFYYDEPAAAYVRARVAAADAPQELQDLFTRPLVDVSSEDRERLIRLGLELGLRLHRFKRTMGLPRVRKVLGILRGVGPDDLLDVGSGRGAFLWPLLDAFPWLPVTAIDVLPHRVADLQAVREGGVTRLTAISMDVAAATFPDRAFDVVTVLEVLEHLPNPGRALDEVLRMARRFIILSVPAKADDNPEHLHLFDARGLTGMLRARSVARVQIDPVLNHLIVVGKLE